MPVVPTNNREPVQLQALPGVSTAAKAPIESFGGGSGLAQQGQATANLGGAVADLAQAETNRANDARILEERRALNEWEYSNLYDPEKGALNKRGKNALGVHEELAVSIKKFGEERMANLSNDTQKNAFQKMILARTEDVRQKTSRHVAVQTEAIDQSEYEASIESSKERAALDPQNNAILEGVVIRNQIAQRAERMGWGEELKKQELSRHESDMHYRAVGGMMASNKDMEAKAYFDKVQNRLDPDIKAKLQEQLQVSSIRGESMRRTDELVKTSGTMTEALAKTKDIKDPELRDATVARVRDHYSMQKQAETMQQDEIFEKSAKTLEETKNKDAIPPSDWLAMNNSQRSSLDSRFAQIVGSKQVVTNWEKYYDLKRLGASAATRDQFLKENMMKYRHLLGDAEFKELTNMQVDLAKGDANADRLLAGFRSTDKILIDTLEPLGFKTNPRPGTAAADRMALFRRALDERIIEYQETNSKKASSVEVQRLVDEMVVKGRTQRGMLWDTEKFAFELSAGEPFEVENVQEVPRAARTEIEQSLARQRLPVSETNILRMYNTRMNENATRR